MAKSKLTLKKLLCNVGMMLMGAFLIGAYFIPVFKTDLGILGTTQDSCSSIIANGGLNSGLTEGTAYTILAVLGLVSMILGCIIILMAVLNLLVKIKHLDLCLLGASLIVAVLAVVMLIIALVKIGGSISLAFGVFAFLIAGVVSTVCAMLDRTK